MTNVILVIHLMITAALIGIVLLQKSEGGALGMGGGMSGFMTGRSTANLLTRMTALLAAAFFVTSIGLAYIAGGTRQPGSVVDQPAPASSQPAQSQPAAPAAPPEPSAPLAK